MIKYGHLDIDVGSKDLEQLTFVDLQQCYCQYGNLEHYYNKHNSSIWQMFDGDCPQWAWDIARNLLSSLSETLSFVVSIVRLEPGNTVPNHVDAHYKVQEQYGKGKTSRYLIMLEDWKMGHYYEVHSQPFVKWRSGDWVRFDKDDWHLAGNMGDEPFYSMQVTVRL